MSYAEQLSLNENLNKRIATSKTLDYYEYSPPINNLLPFIRYQPVFHLIGYLGALVAMGYDAIDVSQGELAYRFGIEFEHQRQPSRRTIGKWLKIISEMGLLLIPRSRVYSDGDTKVISFTDTFKNIVIDKCNVVMCDGVIHALKKRTSIMLESSINPTTNNIYKSNHARAKENCLLLDTTPRVEPEFYENIPVENKNKANKQSKKSEITKEQRQLLWAIRSANSKANHAERQIISYYVISNPSDPVLIEISNYLQDAIKKPTDAEKISFVKQHLEYFREKCSKYLDKSNGKSSKKYAKQIYSFLHWLISCNGVKSDKEVLQLQFVALVNRNDEKMIKLWDCWSRFDNKKRSVAIYRAIKYMRSLEDYFVDWGKHDCSSASHVLGSDSSAESRLNDIMGMIGR